MRCIETGVSYPYDYQPLRIDGHGRRKYNVGSMEVWMITRVFDSPAALEINVLLSRKTKKRPQMRPCFVQYITI